MMIRVLAIMLLSLVSHACGSMNTARNPFDGPVAAGSNSTENPIRIEIRNLNFNDVTDQPHGPPRPTWPGDGQDRQDVHGRMERGSAHSIRN
jgi:hypothetical protein